jgi:hypothetical protein
LHYGDEPGKGFTRELLFEHIEQCDSCKWQMALIARRDKRLEQEYEAFSDRMEKLSVVRGSLLQEADDEYEKYRSEAERLRAEIAAVDLEADEAKREASVQNVFAELNIARTATILRGQETPLNSVALVESIVNAVNQMLSIEDTARKYTLLEMFAATCKDYLSKMAPDPEKLLANAQMTEPTVRYPLNSPVTLELALAVASDSRVLKKSEEPILRVDGGQLLFNQVAYAAAGSAA